MWRGYNEDWERRKAYLYRSLFKDISPLSTVSEEESSRSGPSIHLSPSSVKARRLTDAERGTWTPLPPLTVEREPNRHDEPEEHYQRLEHKMKKLHKWLFIENHSLNSSFDEYSTDENSEQFPSIETFNKTFIVEDREDFGQSSRTSSHFTAAERDPLGPTQSSNRNESGSANKTFSCSDKTLRSSVSSRDSRSNSPEPHSAYKSITVNYQAKSGIEAREQEHSERLAFRSPSSESSERGGYCEQVTFRAEVHRGAFVEDEVISDLLYEKPVLEKHNQLHDYDKLAYLERNSVSDLPTPRNKGATTHYLDVEEIEEMRTPRNHDIRTSFVVTQQHSCQEITEDLALKLVEHIGEVRLPLELISEDSNITRSEKCSDDFNKTLKSSTPRPKMKRRINDENMSDYISPTTSSYKRVRYENTAVQDNERTVWNSVRAHFFAGEPKVFRLCTCINHRCLC